MTDKVMAVGVVCILLLMTSMVSFSFGYLEGGVPDDVTSLPACNYSIQSDVYHEGHWVDVEQGCVTDLQVTP